MRGPPIVTRLGHDECLSLLPSVGLGRVGLNLAALPAVRSVWFALTEDHVVFRVKPGSNLSQAAGSVVAFHADHYDPVELQGWCVQAIGLCEEVTDPVTLGDRRALPLEGWALGGTADHFFQLDLSSLTGERLQWLS
jgi:uncharacterized protein